MSAARQFFLANITRGNHHSAFTRSLLETCARPDSLIGQVYIHDHGPYLDDGRNLCVETYHKSFSDHQLPWLLFVDSDIAFTQDDLIALVDGVDGERFPVVSGLYMNPTPSGPFPLAYRWELSDAYLDAVGQKIHAFTQYTLDELEALEPVESARVEVDCVGMGFCAIHHTLISQLLDIHGFPTPWFCEPIINSVHQGEDMGFCHRVRSLDHPILLDRTIRLTHYKEVMIRA